MVFVVVVDISSFFPKENELLLCVRITFSNNDKEIEAKKKDFELDPSVDVNRRTITDIVWLPNEEVVLISSFSDPKWSI